MNGFLLIGEENLLNENMYMIPFRVQGSRYYYSPSNLHIKDSCGYKYSSTYHAFVWITIKAIGQCTGLELRYNIIWLLAQYDFLNNKVDILWYKYRQLAVDAWCH